MVLMQFPPFVKVISEQIRDFKTSYLQDFQANADSEDDAFINQSISETAEEAELDAKIRQSEEQKQRIIVERDKARAEADGLKQKYREGEEREAWKKRETKNY